jgi:hypothetical protein
MAFSGSGRIKGNRSLPVILGGIAMLAAASQARADSLRSTDRDRAASRRKWSGRSPSH